MLEKYPYLSFVIIVPWLLSLSLFFWGHSNTDKIYINNAQFPPFATYFCVWDLIGCGLILIVTRVKSSALRLVLGAVIFLVFMTPLILFSCIYPEIVFPYRPAI